jgi:hypothetical protein
MASIYIDAVVTITTVNKTPLSVTAEEKSFTLSQQELTNSNPPFEPPNQEFIYLWIAKSRNFNSRPLRELDQQGWIFQEQLLSS